MRHSWILVVLLAACSNNSNADPIVASDYDQACENDSECLSINEGDPCECHVCADAAISSSASGAYDSDVDAHSCTDRACPTIACEPSRAPLCDDGACTLRDSKFIYADDFDRSCAVDDDCFAMAEGESCEVTGMCPTAGINISERDAYFAAQTPCDPAEPTHCDEPYVARCEQGTCIAEAE